jgi:hypothetical protein
MIVHPRPKTKSKSAKIRALVEKGVAVPDIIKATKSSPQLVYAIRHKMRKAQDKEHQGIKSLVNSPAPRATGIAGLRASIVTQPAREITEVITYPKPSLWQRVVNFFRTLG